MPPNLSKRESNNRYRLFFGIGLLIFGLTACDQILVDAPTAFPAPVTPVPPTETDPTATEELEPTAAATPQATEPVALPALHVLEPYLDPGGPVVIDEIWMDTATDGWALGLHREQIERPAVHVLRTADGGETWFEVTPPEDLIPDTEVGGIYTDGQQAWVFYLGTDRVWRTSDGGMTWIASTAGYPMGRYAEIQFADEQRGWMLQEVESGMGSQLVSLFRTTDGGGTWQEIVNPYEVEDLQSCRKTGMDFAGIVSGWVTYDCEGSYLEAFWDVSVDGGATWVEGQLPLPDDAPQSTETGWCTSGSPNLTSDQEGRLVVTCWKQGVNQPSEFFYRTSDGGETWEIFDYPGGRPIYLDKSTILALDMDQYLSSDGGSSWTKVKTVTWVGVFDFVDVNLGWAVAADPDTGEQALVATSDGARTWRIIEPLMASN